MQISCDTMRVEQSSISGCGVMAILSKQRYRVLEPSLPCTHFHPWTNSCLINFLTAIPQTFKGGLKFFLLIYLVHVALKRDLNSNVLRTLAESFIRDGLCVCCISSTSTGAICLMRWALGEMNIVGLGLIPGIIGGAGIFILESSRKDVFLTLLSAMMASTHLQLLLDEGVFGPSPVVEFLAFSFSSTALLFCLRAIRNSTSILWPFVFNQHSEDSVNRKTCSHKGRCLDSAWKIGKRYFLYGLAIQAVKLTLLHFRKLFNKPTSFVATYLSPRNLRLPLFLGLYPSLFKVICCVLREVSGREEDWHTIPAGAVASLCYMFHPNITLSMLAFSNLSQIVSRKYRKRLGLPAWPWKEIAFMVNMGLLFYARAAYPQFLPKYMVHLMDSVTDGRSRKIYNQVENMLQRF